MLQTPYSLMHVSSKSRELLTHSVPPVVKCTFDSISLIPILARRDHLIELGKPLAGEGTLGDLVATAKISIFLLVPTENQF